MALHANKAPSTKTIWYLLTERTPGRLAFATRLAIICALVAVVTQVYTTPEAALTVYIVFFLNKRDRTSSIVTTIALLVIFSLVIVLLLVIATPVLGDPAYRVATMALISFILLFLVSTSKLKPIAGIVALIVAYALDVLSSAPFGEVGTRALLYAWLFVGIPAGVSVIVNLVFAPSPRSIFHEEIAIRLRAAAKALINDGHSAAHDLTHLLSEGDEELQEYLKLSSIEKTSTPEDMAALRGAADATITVLSAVDMMVNEDGASPNLETRRSMAETLSELALIFETGAYPALVEPIAGEPFSSELAQSSLASFNTGLRQFGELKPQVQAAETSGFLAVDAFSNPQHVRYALKTTGAAMLCYLTYSLLSWPGIHTAMITCYIVSLGTAAESVEKLTLRIFGCLAGAGIGLAVMLRVIPLTTDIGHLAFIIFAGTFLAGWTAAGSPRIAYAGFQFAFAFFLCVIQGNSASFDMVVARDRVIGILFGNLVSYFVSTRVWPTSIAPRIDLALEKARSQFVEMGETHDRWQLSRLTAETHGLLNSAEQDLRLLAYEPISLRPTSEWIGIRSRAVCSAQRLGSPLLAAAELERKDALEASINILEVGESDYSTHPSEDIDATNELSLDRLVEVRTRSFDKAFRERILTEEHA